MQLFNFVMFIVIASGVFISGAASYLIDSVNIIESILSLKSQWLEMW